MALVKSRFGSKKAAGDDEVASTGTSSRTRGTDTVARVRSGIAHAVWVLAVIAAVILAVGALLIALDFNRSNGFVKFLTDTADNINVLGVLKDFQPDGKGEKAKHAAEVKRVLVNWGICAVVYLIAGKVLERLIRP